jgi:hypothetical protein
MSTTRSKGNSATHSTWLLGEARAKEDKIKRVPPVFPVAEVDLNVEKALKLLEKVDKNGKRLYSFAKAADMAGTQKTTVYDRFTGKSTSSTRGRPRHNTAEDIEAVGHKIRTSQIAKKCVTVNRAQECEAIYALCNLAEERGRPYKNETVSPATKKVLLNRIYKHSEWSSQQPHANPRKGKIKEGSGVPTSKSRSAACRPETLGKYFDGYEALCKKHPHVDEYPGYIINMDEVR